MKKTGRNVKEIILTDDIEGSDFIPLLSPAGNTEENTEITDEKLEELPILPLRNTVLFPKILVPIQAGRKKSIELVKHVNENGKIFGIVSQKNPKVDNPDFDDLHKVGTIAKLIKILEMPDGSTSVIIQGISRMQINEFISDKPFITAKVSTKKDILPESEDAEFDAITSSLKEISLKIIELSHDIPPEASFAVKNIENSQYLLNFICTNSNLTIDQKQQLIEIDDVKKRAIKLLDFLNEEVLKLKLKDDIQLKVKRELDRQQREYFLNQQIKTIQDELGGNPFQIEIDELEKKAKNKKWPQIVADTFNKEIKRLQRINPASPEYSIILNYVQTLVDLPWKEYTKDNFNLKRAQKVLDKDHYGLDEVKERILEYLAVLKLKGDLKSPIICLYGPPGVGKTSLGKSIAKALNRKYIRMSLGGLHDEAEIRGHRKTYIGAMPGRIIQSIRKAKSANPVFVLDEIDKVGSDFRGDPASALLEVLDPEQNTNFYDNFLELEFDLSKVLFVATANNLSTISPALLDRMEIINVTGYIIDEKIEIAKRHLLPRLLKDHGVKKSQLKLENEVLEFIIESYTRESGVRQLDKTLARIVRKTAKKIGFGEKIKAKLNKEDILEYLGAPKYIKGKYDVEDYAGVVTGLAWTSVGGKILYVETSLSRGNGKLTLTGNLGNVMKESATLALEYIKSHYRLLRINPNVFKFWDIHIHVPEGAIPKDGPSAGITMVTSIASAFTQRKVKPYIAMTGEITLRGKVLPVGGIKEKILAAKRSGIKEIILSEENKKDIDEIKPIYIEGLKFHYVERIDQVLEIALCNEKVSNPIKIGVPKNKN